MMDRIRSFPDVNVISTIQWEASVEKHSISFRLKEDNHYSNEIH